jgi:hypothetical protein
MSYDPMATEAMRDAQRRAAAKERATDELKAKVREVREVMTRLGIKERSPGEYVVDFKTLIKALGPEQAQELAQELDAQGITP